MAERDLTSGSLFAHLRAMAVPAALGMVFSTLYNIVDTYYAGWISTESQAGLALSFVIFMGLMAVGFGLSQATGALVGGALGGKRPDEALACAAQSLFLAVATGVVLALAGVVISGPVMKFLGAKPEIFWLVKTT